MASKLGMRLLIALNIIGISARFYSESVISCLVAVVFQPRLLLFRVVAVCVGN